MKYYIKQKAWSWRERFEIWDENENLAYYTEAEKVFSWTDPRILYNAEGEPLVRITGHRFAWLPSFDISIGDRHIATIKKEFSFWKSNYSVDGFGLSVIGDFWAHDYEVLKEGQKIASINKKYWSWTDTFEIDVFDERFTEIIIAIVLVIDTVLDASESS